MRSRRPLLTGRRIGYLDLVNAPTLNDLVDDLLRQAQGAVDRIVIRTNIGVMTLNQPLVGDPNPSPPGLPARLLQPQIDLYARGTVKPIATYAPYGKPTPRPEIGALMIFGVGATIATGFYLMARGARR